MDWQWGRTVAECYEAKIIDESDKGWQPSGVEPRTPLAWAASALPLSYNNQTTTNPHNPRYVLHRWYWMPQSHTRQPLSMCHQNFVRGWPEVYFRLITSKFPLFPAWGKMLWACHSQLQGIDIFWKCGLGDSQVKVQWYILTLMKEELPVNADEDKEICKDYPHTEGELT